MNLVYLRAGGIRPTYHLASWQEIQKCEKERGPSRMSRLTESRYFHVPGFFLKIQSWLKASVEERG